MLNRRRATVAALGLPWVGRASAQSGPPVEGRHYTVLAEPRPPVDPRRIEVLEFFSYACPACFAFDAPLEKWVSNLPADVVFRRVPVPFSANAPNFQRAFFAQQIAGTPPVVHARIFSAVHVAKRALTTAEAFAEVVASAGGDKARFVDAFNAFSMGAMLARAKAQTADYGIDRIPTLAIAGRTLTSPAQAGGAQQALSVADALIQKARKP